MPFVRKIRNDVMWRVYSKYYEGSCCGWLCDELLPSTDWLIEVVVFIDWLDDCGEVEFNSLMFHFALPMSLDETDFIVAETYNGKVRSSSSVVNIIRG